MSEAPEKKTTSKLMTLVYIILAIVALTVFLELTGLADVAGTRESEQLIDRPH